MTTPTTTTTMSIPTSITQILKAGPIHFGPFIVTTQVAPLPPPSPTTTQ